MIDHGIHPIVSFGVFVLFSVVCFISYILIADYLNNKEK